MSETSEICVGVPAKPFVTYVVYVWHHRNVNRHIAHFSTETHALICAQALRTYYDCYSGWKPLVSTAPRLWSFTRSQDDVGIAFSNTGHAVPTQALLDMVNKNDTTALHCTVEDIPHDIFGEAHVGPLPWWRDSICVELLSCCIFSRYVPCKVLRHGHSVKSYRDMACGAAFKHVYFTDYIA
jgi:hypothetical protein